jgi:hypothetical protein
VNQLLETSPHTQRSFNSVICEGRNDVDVLNGIARDDVSVSVVSTHTVMQLPFIFAMALVGCRTPSTHHGFSMKFFPWYISASFKAASECNARTV